MIKRILLIFFYLVLFFNLSFAENFTPFQGRINAQGINIRCSSTINSEVISKANKGEQVSVVSQAYEWYKVQLPKNAAIFVNKDFLAPVNEKTTPALTSPPLNGQPQPQLAKVIKDNVNIRLSASEKSSIIGKLSLNQAVTVLNITGGWAQILPVTNSYGWVNKKFVDRIPEPEKKK
ncbi:MAG: SH3 domain-containing protein [Candidatus Omnitrophica bacterium]|nr:SH3 domain-containing protein [Candidatus Omnitrophota bacterium]